MKWINHDRGYLNLENIIAIEIELGQNGYRPVAYDKNQRPYSIGLPFKTPEEAKANLDRLIADAKDVAYWSPSEEVKE